MSGESKGPAFRLFGVPRFESAAGTVNFTHERPYQVLAYLACRRMWVRRDDLCELLWPGHVDASAARSNLRKVLLLCARLPGVELERHLDRVRWLPDSDLERFDRACDARQWEEAIELYAGALLEGMDSGFAADWLRAERQRLDGRWQHACEQRLQQLAGSPVETVALAERMLAREPLDENAIHALAQARLALGQRHSAARVLSTYAAALANELGLEPSASLRELTRQVQAHPATEVADASRPYGQVPADHGFIGRRIESAEILRLLQSADCRCLTIQGPGGIGKSSMARAITASLAAMRPAPQVAWVALSDLTDADQLPARFASTLDFGLQGDVDPWAAVAAALERTQSPVVVVLDNAEHLALAARMDQLIGRCPHVQLLVTSRSRLGAAGERLLPMEGLPLPDSDETDAAVLRHCDAVRLFELRATALTPGFDLATQATDVVRLVHLVEGLPLAIELAASWTRVLPVSEIVAELATSVDLLEDAYRPERGLRASFAQSWRMLGPAERDSLPRLALLPVPFDREMALHVGHAPLPVLASLIDKSLVRRSSDGRFSLHELIRQCASEHAEDAADVRKQHAQLISHWLRAHAEPTRTIPMATFEAIESELPHVRAAWSWAIDEGNSTMLLSMTEAVAAFFETRGMWQEGMQAMGRAIAAVENGDPVDTLALSAVLRAHARLALGGHELALSEASARRLLKSIPHGGAHRSMVLSALNTLGKCLRQRGRLVEARQVLDHGRRRAQAGGTAKEVSWFTSNLAIVDLQLGRYETALEGLEAELAERRGSDNVAGTMSSLNNIACAHRGLRQPARALESARAALALCEQHRLLFMKAYVLLNMGAAYDELGDGAAARLWLGRALAESRERQVPDNEAETLLTLARLEAGAGAHADARRYLAEAQLTIDRLDSNALRLVAIAAHADIAAGEGRIAEAAGWLRWAIAQPDIQVFDREVAERRLASLEALVPSAAAASLAFDPATPPRHALARLTGLEAWETPPS